MKILISTTDSNTPIELVNGLPDLSAYSEPTKSILQSAFDEGNYVELREPIVESAPKEIDARRLRLALLELNLFDTIEAAIASQGKAAQLEWEFATTISEAHPLVVTLVAALNLNVDQIFDLAESYQ